MSLLKSVSKLVYAILLFVNLFGEFPSSESLGIDLNNHRNTKESYFEDENNPLHLLTDNEYSTHYYIPNDHQFKWFSLYLQPSIQVNKEYYGKKFEIKDGIRSIIVFNGNQKSKNDFNNFGRIKKLTYYVYNAKVNIHPDVEELIYRELKPIHSQSFILEDSMEPQILKIDKKIDLESSNKTAKTLLYQVFVIDEYYPGNEIDKICISGINFQDWNGAWYSYFALPIARNPKNVIKYNKIIDGEWGFFDKIMDIF